METLSHTRESASSFVRQVASHLRSSSPHGFPDLADWATTSFSALRDAIFRLAYVARGKVIQWSLALANHLQRAQARAIARAASANGQGLPAGIVLPPPSFPKLDRSALSLHRSALPLDRSALPLDRSALPLDRTASPSVPSKARLSSVFNVSSGELRYEDFDDAPTAVYHPIPTREDELRAAYPHPATTRRSTRQGEVRISSK